MSEEQNVRYKSSHQLDTLQLVVEQAAEIASLRAELAEAKDKAKTEESIRRELVDNICYAGAIGVVIRSRASGETEVITIKDDFRNEHGECCFVTREPSIYSPTAYNALHSYETSNNPDHPDYAAMQEGK